MHYQILYFSPGVIVRNNKRIVYVQSCRNLSEGKTHEVRSPRVTP